MKHKNKYLTRIYLYLDILEFLILHNEYNNSINKFDANRNINDLFLETFNIEKENIEMEMYENILNTYKKEEYFINNVREKFQHRHTIMMDKQMIILLNLAIAEYLAYKLDKKLIIKIYVDMASLFSESTEFVHGVLDKSLEFIINNPTL